MKNARTHARTHALRIRIRIAPTAPQLLTPNPSAAPIITAAHKTHPTHTQNSTAFSTALKRPTARLTAHNLSAAAQKLSNVFNAARKSLTKTHHQNSTAFKHPTARLTARSLSAVAQKLSNSAVFNAARKSLTKTYHQNTTALKRPTARLTARNLSVAACRHTQFHILTAHPAKARQHPARAPRPVSTLRASRRAVCFFYSHLRLNDLDGIHKAN